MKKKSNIKDKVKKGVAGALLATTLLTQPTACADHEIIISAEEIQAMDEYDNKYGILVNKSNKITEQEMNNIDLVSTTNVDGEEVYLQRDALDAFNKLKEALKKEEYTIEINEGFRSYEDQEAVYNELVASKGKEYADKYTAPVGHSEHHTGLAIDVYIDRTFIAGLQIPLSINPKYIATINKMYEIMADYGFILRYPEGKEEITGYPEEAWHIRYVGVELAKFLTEKEMTLEEYYEKVDYYQNLYSEEMENIG